MVLGELHDDYPATRDELRRIATHICARARHRATGRFGLRPTPGGFGTPAYGADGEVVRISGGLLVVDRAGDSGSSTRSVRVDGASLLDLATFVEVTLDPSFSVGHDTAGLGDVAAPLAIHDSTVVAAGAWLAFAQRLMDDVVADLGGETAPSAFQLWPEHFDLGGDVLLGPGRVNLGAALGDGFHSLPYLYVAPWDDRRPGPISFWNAPFGAAIGYDELAASTDPRAMAQAWIGERLAVLRLGG